MKKAALLIAILAMCVSLVSLAFCLKPISAGKTDEKTEAQTEEVTQAQAEDIQYVLYLGTNDKDTNEPVFEPEEAKTRLKEILISYMGGYTIQEANGGWTDDTGKEYQEYTLVIYLSDTDADTVHKLCDELIATYNQSSVLIQMNKTQTEFYAGSEK